MTIEQLEQATTSKWMRLAILPIEDCNLDCVYCYEDHRKLRERLFPPMSAKVVSGINNWIKAQYEAQNLQKVNLSWFGGEPLMAPDVIDEISQWCIHLGINTVGDMTTNGTALNLKMLTRMVKLNHVEHFKISLDGAREDHDQTRIVKLSKKQMLVKNPKRKGTFDKIWKNLLEAKKSGLRFQITLRIHVTRANIGQKLDDFVREVYNTFTKDDKRFKCEFEEIHDMGGLDDKTKALIMKKEDTPGYHIARLKNIVGNDGLITHQKKDAPAYWCYAAKLNNWLVRASGAIGKCTVQLDATFAKINEDGTVNITNPDLVNMWYEGFADGKLENLNLWALACPASYMIKKYGTQQMNKMGFK